MSDRFMIGKTISHYKIAEQLGEGGMGVVYKAEDTRLKRSVALKFLKLQTLGNEEERTRFLHEAQAAASLDHPNICTVHEIDNAESMTFIAMSYIKGQSLSEKIAGSPLKLSQAFGIAIEVAEGLQEAHENGIVHRDIKPANIMLTTKGHAKIMDFGLAKLVNRTRITETGVTLGTAAYMSPEQSQGQGIDLRTDIWSLGVVLYEMVTGRLPFRGEYETAMIYSLLHEQPEPVTSLRTGVPMALELIINKALSKNPDDRYQHVDDFLSELRKVQRESTHRSTTMGEVSRPTWPRLSVIWITAILVIVIGMVWISGNVPWRHNRGPKPIQVTTTKQITNAAGLEIHPAISPDGKLIAYISPVAGKLRIYVRHTAGGRTITLTPSLPGNQESPRWSPDGSRIAFQSEGRIYAVTALGGIPSLLAEPTGTAELHSPAWSPDGLSIAFVQGRSGVTGPGAKSAAEDSIFVKSLATEQTMKIAKAYAPHSLSWSPEGSQIAFVSGNPEYVFRGLGNVAPSSVWVVCVKGQEPVRITDHKYLNMSPTWAHTSNRLYFISTRGGSRDVYWVAVDKTGSPEGEIQRLTTGIDASTINLARNGNHLVYSVYAYLSNIWSVPIPTMGTVSMLDTKQITTGAQTIESKHISPDGAWIVYDSNVSGNSDIYRMPLYGGEAVQLTSHPSDDFAGPFSPDGSEILFTSFRNGNRDVFTMSSDGRSVQPITDDLSQDRAPDWSPDGRQIAFSSDRTGRYELYTIFKQDETSSWSLPHQLTVEGCEVSSRWSPDGRFIMFSRYNKIFLVQPQQGNQQIAINGHNLKPPIRLQGFEWATNARTVYFYGSAANGLNSIFSLLLKEARPRLIMQFDDPLLQPSENIATDKTHLYFTLATRESDIWLMELATEKEP